MKLTLGLCAVAAAPFASAFTGVVPPDYTNTEANGTFLLLTSNRSYMMLIDESQLTSFVGSNITGLTFRLNAAAGSNWPNNDASWTDFDIYMGASVDPTAVSTTVASNFTSGLTQVRSGGLDVTAGTWGSGGSPNSFGPAIDFNQGYTYTGGDLGVVIRMSTISGSPGSFSADAATTSASGYGTQFVAKWTGSYDNPVIGTNGNMAITQFTAEAVPEPATMAALALGAVALIRRKRK